ncbi:MAG: PepSY domain-containing protein [Flavisolibacter sp.]|nr:PepSY domain-containing protein [Flavisolibacter sp.]
MAKSKHFYIRRTHRYLGLILGVQFLLWTVSGLYFSWTNIDEIHGDFEHRQPAQLGASFNLISPSAVINQLPQKADSINQVQLISILQKPFYTIRYYAGDTLQTILADAQTGIIRQPVNKDEALKIAAESFAGIPAVQSIKYITSVSKNDEYREKPLPAWKISFQNRANTHVYVSSVTGKVETLRNNKWRTFDLLWMFHTMDYNGRDNINNWVLRAFSIFGILTVLSGFALFWVSSKWARKQKLYALTKAGK